MAPAIRHDVYRCRVCRGVHPLRSCQRFLQLPAVKRLRAVLINKYCANCLAHEHSGRSCRSKARCRICREAHHTLLHIRGEHPGSSRPQRKREPQAAPQPQRRQEVGSTGSLRSASPMDSSQPRSSLSTPTGAPSLVRTSVSILPTAAVLIGSEQKRFDVRVLVDPCCPVSRIHVSLVKALNLAVTGVGNERLCTTEIRSKTSRMSKQLLMRVDEQMQSRTPAQPLDPKVQDMFHNMTLADDRWFHPALVSAVLGADVYADLMLPGIIASQDGLPMAQNSKLGWILSGRCSLS
ncbi:uncharacterized protein LOC120457664 [Drosophila santomea]|uniref:uncharacterized protein LOC120457664 n=1 Tax=Drosophila santomea TaxID=129105 RepID=UPI0019531A44|nr:uncharacterized protein LOC120457664 [Drosophila santomea]